MTSVEPTPLVGRDAELATLRALLDGSAPGAPGAAIVSGEAGIGKTRLLREFARAAAAEGALVLVGHCVSFGGDAVPFLPVSEAFGRLARDEPETVDRLREHYPPLTRLLPQRRLVGSDGAEGRLDPADLYEAVLGALFDLAADRRVLLVVEDLHWADGATRDLFGFLLARLAGEPGAPVVPVASYRSDDLHRRHPLRTVVLEWGRLPGVLRVGLQPLERADVAALVRGLAGGSDDVLGPEVLDDVLDRAQGNAFFAEQLLAELTARRAPSVGVPRDLADLLLLRLERLAPETRHVLQVVAVAGRQIDHDRLVRVAGLDDARLHTALREATDAHVLDRTPADGYAFRHALLAEAVYDDLLPGERRHHHAQFAEVIARQELPGGTDADLARHAREAGDLATAFDAGIRAGDEAMRVAAPGEAMRLYEAAQELGPAVSDARTAVELPRKAASAASHAGNPFRAVHLLEEALRRLPDDAAPDVRSTLLIELTEHALTLDVGFDVIQLARQALDAIPEEPPTALRARALAALARALSTRDRHADESIAYAEQARAVAVQVGIPNVEADAVTTRGRVERWRAADPDVAERLLRDSMARARESGDLPAKLRSVYSLALFQYESGLLEEGRRTFAEGAAIARDAGRPWAPYGADALVMCVQADYVAGHWDEALRTAESYPEAPPLHRAGLAMASLAVHTGRGATDVVRRAEAHRAWWKRDAVLGIMGGSALIDAYGTLGDVTAALATHDDVVDTVATLWNNRWFDARFRLHALMLGVLAGAVAPTGDAERTALVARGEQLIEDVRRVVEGVMSRRGSLGPESGSWVARAEAEWARLRWSAGVGGSGTGVTGAGGTEITSPTAEELVEAWRTSVDRFGYGHRYETARSTARLAAALAATGDPAGAQREAEAARTIAQELRAAPLLAELSALAVARPAAERRETDLTPREQQVLELLALGRTNRQIGRALFISDKTVSVHVSNLMAKLGAAGRTEAAALARRAGLLGGPADGVGGLRSDVPGENKVAT
ncbi:helix-turn-helix transcriptional regulator [Cryptosporangium minutisporangium]|uniref:Helix-turn-helix transcriptional regulator n=1 Tax=Cryptosporangium minutisporangium TaxID=113569 RepID=A0ABP6T6P3_9ACTN